MSTRRTRRSGAAYRGVGLALIATVTVAIAAETTVASPDDNAQVVHGDVTFIQDGNRTIIQASDGSIIHYLDFNIGPNDIVQFIQPHELARVLNRITGPDPTVIQGTLLANGQVYIVNPAGVLFGNGAVVDAAGLYAAAGHISNNDFLSGRNEFTGLSGTVTNYGVIEGDRVHLLGRSVANHGEINAYKGLVTMLAGNDILIKEHGGHITVKIDGEKINDRRYPLDGQTPADMHGDPAVENTGTITAKKGEVILGAGDIASLAIRNSGTIHADRGHITVAAHGGLIHNQGVISAGTERGTAGSVTVQGPSILNDGEISADSGDGQAGFVEVTSQNHTFLRDGSIVSAAGGQEAHGGKILIHSYGGHTAMQHGAVVDVSGGSAAGHGGFVEVSGLNLTFNGEARLGAQSRYRAGHLHLDPRNIFVQETGPDDSFLNDNMITFDEGGILDDATISAAALEALLGTITLEANEGIFIFEPIHLQNGNDLILLAGNEIDIHGAITGANDLTIHANRNDNGWGPITISVPIEIFGEFYANSYETYLNGATLSAGESVTFDGHADICVDMVITAPDIHFMGGVDATFPTEHGLTANGDVIFDGAVSALRTLRYLEVNGRTDINGGFIGTTDWQTFNGNVFLGDDAIHQSHEAGDITFNGRVRGGGLDLEVYTGGTTRFLGALGTETAPLDFLLTDPSGTTRLNSLVRADSVIFADPVFLDDTVRIFAAEDVSFFQTIQGQDHSLFLYSPDILFGNDVLGMNTLHTEGFEGGDSLVTIGGGFSPIGGGGGGPIIIEGNVVDFNSDVLLEADATITGDELLNFGGTINGDHTLVANSNVLIRFGGDVGGDQRLHTLEANTPGLIEIHGNQVLTTQDIRFNPMGRSDIPMFATIAALGGDLTLDAEQGDILFGPNEKLTVAMGDLSMHAGDGSITVGDLNAFGDIDLNAQNEIRIRLRDAAGLRTFAGETIMDEGVDFIAGGRIRFNRDPVLLGSGPDPFFATASGSNISSVLRERFETREKSGFGQEIFFLNGQVLDLTADPADTPPPPGPPETDNLAEALGADTPQIEDRVPLPPFALRPLGDLAINMRPLSEDELLATTTGREFYNDTLVNMPVPGRVYASATNRLQREAVLNVLDAYAALYGIDPTDDEPDDAQIAQRAAEIQQDLAAAWNAYAAQTEGEPTAEGFRQFLNLAEGHEAAYAHVQGLRRLYREMHIMGVTPREMRAAIEAGLLPVVPDPMDRDQLQQVILEGIG